VNICDHFASRPFLSIPRLASETEHRLQGILPEENVDTANPVDPGATGLGRFRELLDTVAADPHIDTLLFLLGIEFMEEVQEEEMRLTIVRMMAKEFARINRKGKPMIILLRQLRRNNQDSDRYRKIILKSFYECGVPWVDGGFDAIVPVIEKIAAWRAYREQMAAAK
jgi:acyl-CoA synthetase (NDP forming)